MSDRITVHSQDGQPLYDIMFRRNFDGLEAEICRLGFAHKKICIVTDSTVAGHYLEPVRQVAGRCGALCTEFVFPAGEDHKNLDVVRSLYEHLILHQFDRKDLLVALGGGVVGDLTGFAAATYLRGIAFVQVPTTLLAQVDSSIGGKTGVDFDCYKNMVGAFYMPKLVYMNLTTLNTLTERQYREGLGEIIKHGLIRDERYFSWLETHMEQIGRRELDVCEPMIRRSCEIKRDVVERDPNERGERALLNYGHTLGHAVEKEIGFSMLHGECVALGCIAAAGISLHRGDMAEETFERILALIRAAGLPVTVSGPDPEKVLEATRHDKKMDAGAIRFILLRQIGDAVIDSTVTLEEMGRALKLILC